MKLYHSNVTVLSVTPCFRHLEQFLESICNGIRDPRPVVYNAGLFALGQFSEHLQPEISRYHNQLLPLLFGYLALTTSQNVEQRPKGITRIYYALEMFCENLGKNGVFCAIFHSLFLMVIA